MSNNYADQWAELLANVPAKEEAEPTAEIELCGFKFLGRRIPLQAWIRSGRLPQALLMQLLEVSEGQATEAGAGTLRNEDLPAAIQFQRDAVMQSVVEPRIVQGKPKKGEISYMQLCEARPDLIDAIINWVIAGSPGVPVPTKKGATSVESLSRFRQKRPGGVFAEPVPDGADVRSEAESTVAVAV